MSMTINTDIGAGQTIKFKDLGDFIRITVAPSALTLRLFKNGQVLSESIGVSAGFAEELDDEFHEFEVYSATAQTIQLVSRHGTRVYFDAPPAPPTGNVNIVTPVQVSPVNTNPTVTNASAQLLAANAARKFLLIQNKDSVGRIYLNFGAGAATVANGLVLEPGEEFAPVLIPVNAIQAIGDKASNANITVVEG